MSTLLSREHMFFDANALVPIVRWPEIADHFVNPEEVSYYSVMLGQQVVMTAPLRLDRTINLLEVSQPSWQVGEDITDWVGEDVKFARLYFRVAGRSSSKVVILDVLEDVTHSSSVHSYAFNFGYTNQKRVDRFSVSVNLSGWLNRQTGELKVRGGCAFRTMDVGIEVIGFTLAANRVPQ